MKLTATVYSVFISITMEYYIRGNIYLPYSAFINLFKRNIILPIIEISGQHNSCCLWRKNSKCKLFIALVNAKVIVRRMARPC